MKLLRWNICWCVNILTIVIFSKQSMSESLQQQTKQYPQNYYAPSAAYQSQMTSYNQPQQQIGGLLGNILGNAITGNQKGGLGLNLAPPNSLNNQANMYPQQSTYGPMLAQSFTVPSSTKKDPADELELQMAKRNQIMKQNPFFQLSNISMKVRELATQNPEMLEQIGVFTVKIKPEETYTPEEQKSHDIAQGAADVGEGVETPCAACKENDDKEAKSELENLKNADKQKFLLRTMDPTQQAAYIDRQKATLKKAIRIQKNILEIAKHEMRKLAKESEQ